MTRANKRQFNFQQFNFHINFRRIKALALAIFFLNLFPSFAEVVNDSVYKYSLDFPEGFVLDDFDPQNGSYFFSHPNIPVCLALVVYKDPNITDSHFSLEVALKKLSGTFDIDQFTWNGSKCAIADFSMTLDQDYAGWAVSAPLQNPGAFLNLICYAPKDKRPVCNQFIMSLLNSLCTNQEYYSTPGIIVTYAFPKEGKKDVNLNIAGQRIHTNLDKSDLEGANFLIDMEFSVLTLYANHPLKQKAWERYYRLIYRDSFGRLENCISDVLDVLVPLAMIKSPQNQDLFIAQTLLSWVQDFDYKRNNASKSSSDFTSLPATICGEGNDCDSRSLLICMFMRSMGYESLLLVSPEFLHALASVEMDAPGQKYVLEGSEREFLIGETTAKVTWGMIAQDFADRSKWFPVFLP